MKHYYTHVERDIYPEGRSVSHKPNAQLVHACDECRIHLSVLFCDLMVESAPASLHDWSPGTHALDAYTAFSRCMKCPRRDDHPIILPHIDSDTRGRM